MTVPGGGAVSYERGIPMQDDVKGFRFGAQICKTGLSVIQGLL
jgi:hypothetical protein